VLWGNQPCPHHCQKRKRSGDFSRAAFVSVDLDFLDDAGQHEDDDERQRHSE
jgi:hypothetical protein